MKTRATVLLLLIATSPLLAQQTTEATKERWSDFLPLMKQLALDNMSEGQTLPLPFGVSLNTIILQRDTEVKDIKAAINGEPGPVEWAGVDSSTRARNATARLDAWLLPFFNVYGIIGYTESDSDVAVTIDFDDPATVEFPVENSGVTTGFGVNLAGGYNNWFASVDANWSVTDLGGVFDEELEALVVGLRSGFQTNFRGKAANVWLSATYWDTEREMSGSIPLPGIRDNVINFSIVQGPTDPWSFGIGGQATFSEEWQAVLQLDSNFDDMFGIIAALGYRF